TVFCCNQIRTVRKQQSRNTQINFWSQNLSIKSASSNCFWRLTKKNTHGVFQNLDVVLQIFDDKLRSIFLSFGLLHGHFIYLTGIFQIYDSFDALSSVSQGLLSNLQLSIKRQ